MRRISNLSLLLALLCCRPAAAGFDHAHTTWDELLAERVRDGLVDYSAIAADPSRLEAYLGQLEAVAPDEYDGFDQDQRMAFWMNAYNAYTIKLIIDHHPVDSIKKIGGLLRSPFKLEFIPLARLRGGDISLDTIEHGILRKEFADARIHAGIVCASLSCPELAAEAFVAERLDQQLDDAMRRFLADRSRNRWTADSAELELSAIFKWFREDFERDAGSLTRFVIDHAPEPMASALGRAERIDVDFLRYDWTLNGR